MLVRKWKVPFHVKHTASTATVGFFACPPSTCPKFAGDSMSGEASVGSSVPFACKFDLLLLATMTPANSLYAPECRGLVSHANSIISSTRWWHCRMEAGPTPARCTSLAPGFPCCAQRCHRFEIADERRRSTAAPRNARPLFHVKHPPCVRVPFPTVVQSSRLRHPAACRRSG